MSEPEPPDSAPRTRAGAARDFFLRTLTGRLIGLGAVVKVVCTAWELAGGPAGMVVRVVSTLGGAAVAVGAGILAYRLARLARRHLLWRVRRRLIISYIFIGVVPAILIAAFFLLAGLLLFANLSTFLIRTSLREMSADALAIARTTRLEIDMHGVAATARGTLDLRLGEIRNRYPGLSIAVVAADPARCPRAAGAAPGIADDPDAELRLGPWAHAAPPAAIPAWVSCAGFAGVIAVPASGPSSAGTDGVRAVIRGVAVQGGHAVVADLPVDGTVRRRLEAVTGITLGRFGLVSADGTALDTTRPAAPGDNGVLPGDRWRFPWVALLDHADWQTGRLNPLTVQIGLSVGEVYERLSASQASMGAQSYGDLLIIALTIITVLFVIIEVGALAMGLALARSITGSVHELFAGTERVRQGDFGHRIAVRVKDQLGELADSFNLMTASIEDLLRQAAEKKRLEEEMRLAREIQTSLLPPGPLHVPGAAVTAVCVPAREVGGDYYDIIPLGDGRVGLLIADVAGKGMSAALYMAELKGLMLSLTKIHRSPRDLLISANRLISEHLDSRSFITMTYAVLDARAGTMTYARAGHTPLIHVPRGPRGDGRARILAPDGMVVGLRIDGGERFEAILQEATLPLADGDVLVFFTDGISEAMNVDSECFGELRLAQLIEGHAHLPFDELRERLLREIDAFVGAAPQHDDMTMILLRMGDPVCPTP